MTERIQKVLSQWGIASRRQAEKMILAGRVKLNGNVAVLGDKVDLDSDLLEVDGRSIRSTQRPKSIYLLINKPLAVISSCSDPQKRTTVIDLLPDRLKKGQGIHPVGRLDYNSTGALILTNDGNLTLSLTHPRYHLAKTYRVILDGIPSQQDIQRWREGISLEGRSTLPAKVEIINFQQDRACLEVILTEGRNRQIRKVAELLGFRVVSLHRTMIGKISLDTKQGTELKSGEYRHLSKQEISFLQRT